MFGWIPIIGPIIDGIVSIWTRTIDLKAVKYKVDGTVDIEAIRASANIIEATKDDIGVRLCRDIICFPVALWCALITWDTIWAYHNKALMWGVAGFGKTEISYLPVAVITFLLGNIGINAFRRR